MKSNSGVYAILANDVIVYVGQSQDLLRRMLVQMKAIAAGTGLAGRYPKIFRGAVTSVRVLEYIDHGTPPPDPRNGRELRAGTPEFGAAFGRLKNWCEDARQARLLIERGHIERLQPACNVRGKRKAVSELVIEDVEAMRVCLPVAPDQRATTLQATA